MCKSCVQRITSTTRRLAGRAHGCPIFIHGRPAIADSRRLRPGNFLCIWIALDKAVGYEYSRRHALNMKGGGISSAFQVGMGMAQL